MPSLNPQLAQILLAAYRPCPAFFGPCAEMRWAPEAGHAPRGFCGAAGSLQQVALVLICAEPGDPHPTECHPGRNPEDLLRSAYDYAYECWDLITSCRKRGFESGKAPANGLRGWTRVIGFRGRERSATCCVLPPGQITFARLLD